MPQVVWNDSFNTDILMIDNQHRKLVQIMNELGTAMSAGRGREALCEALSGLFAYTKYHFEAEEKEMRANAYPEEEQHRKAHREFAERLSALNEKLKGGGFPVTVETMHFLSRWIQDHIMVQDKAFGRFLAGLEIALAED